MGRVFCWLNQNPLESAGEYDNRINHLPALHAGYAYFSWANYDAINHNFSVYAVWNGEFNDKLHDQMPQGGYMIHCEEAEAIYLISEASGVPIYMKLCSKQGRLYAGEMYIVKNE
ncbi:MAG TPA: hypothetical protein PLZ77_08860, partial [Lachnospiraceae bacterium]|nr:hypothetical protein [Lachnospiraceae bacterium]